MELGTFLDHHGIIIHNAWGYELAYPALDGGHVMFFIIRNNQW
jgi:hypothetical protein